MPFRGFFLLSNSNGEQWEEEREIESGGGRIESKNKGKKKHLRSCGATSAEMLLSFSDLVLFSTLVLNGAAILNFKLPTKEVSFQQEENNKVVELLLRLRMLRVFIALWNVVVLFLMVVMFGS